MTMKCMRSILAICVSLLLFSQVGPVVAKGAKPADSKLVEQAKMGLGCRGEQLLDAIKNDNIVGYGQCWVSDSVMFKFWSKKEWCRAKGRSESRTKQNPRPRPEDRAVS